MKKNAIKVVALAIAGALLPVIGYLVGSTDYIYVEPVNDESEPEEEEVSQDTQ